MKENSIRRAVREGRAALGTGLKEFASRGVPWIIEAAGFDYCAIDHEHGAFDIQTIANLASWFQATNVSPIVRLHKSFAHLIPGILDQGIMGIQVSEVETVEEAQAIVRLAKYPPLGNRGISGQGPHTLYKSYGRRHATEYAPWANENIILFPSIESLDGLENVEKIAAVESGRTQSGGSCPGGVTVRTSQVCRASHRGSDVRRSHARSRPPEHRRIARRSCPPGTRAVSSARPRDRNSNAGRYWQGAERSPSVDPF